MYFCLFLIKSNWKWLWFVTANGSNKWSITDSPRQATNVLEYNQTWEVFWVETFPPKIDFSDFHAGRWGLKRPVFVNKLTCDAKQDPRFDFRFILVETFWKSHTVNPRWSPNRPFYAHFGSAVTFHTDDGNFLCYGFWLSTI